ncbi:MAG TPA: NAD(P)H-dependent glycerol-3-phosphate dehydrogenase, partial [Dehalococcoidia bacterium]|nr:NAD(P)H-dependent glycerol-3-phosphate dehydrogenase [Dehalococcoidia bacterium]
VGTTTWGTTLGIFLARNCIPVTILARSPDEAKELNSCREHRRFLPSVSFPENLMVSDDVAEAVSGARLIIIAVPSHQFRQNVQWVKKHLPPQAWVLSATKGLELSTSMRMSQVLEEELPAHLHPGICVLSGPNLAKEIAQGKPSSTAIAGKDPATLAAVQEILMSPLFRVYTSDDVVGVELGGALKNIIALGAGFADGLEIGDNTKAAFITRGVAEITRLGLAAGAQPLTFAGLAGLGDIVATCASRLSRNRHVGEQLACGKTWPEIRQSMDNVAEGVNTTEAALHMAAGLDVEMPITQVTHRVLFEGLPPHRAIKELMERPPRSEW